jgi:hypothetical protein
VGPAVSIVESGCCSGQTEQKTDRTREPAGGGGCEQGLGPALSESTAGLMSLCSIIATGVTMSKWNN